MAVPAEGKKSKSRFVGREEFCDLMVSRRTIERIYLEDADIFALRDVLNSQQFLIRRRDLYLPREHGRRLAVGQA